MNLLTNLEAAFKSACSTLNKEYVFGFIGEDLEPHQKKVAATEVLFIRFPLSGELDADVLRDAKGQVTYSVDIEALQRFNEDDKTGTEPRTIKIDAANQLFIDVVSKVCEDKLIAKGIRGTTTTRISRNMHTTQYIGVKGVINFVLDYC